MRTTHISSAIKTREYHVLSLFAGCGGLDLGFRGEFTVGGNTYAKRMFNLIWSNDINKNACLTYQRYFHKEIVCGDIWKILEGTLSGVYPFPEHVDVVLGGFPCQDFSIAGKRQGFSSKRGTLYKSMVEVVKRTQPKIFIAENVKGLLSINKGRALEIIKEDFEALGYHVSHQLFHVADYGVPQNRERVIIVGVKTGSFIFPKPTTSQHKTVYEAIRDLEDLDEGAVPNHWWSKAKRVPGSQGNLNIEKDKISPTMRAEHHGNIEFHWNGKRRLSAREAARIQTFPDDFIFYPSTSAAYKQIGNAVPPVFGWHLAKAVEEFLNYTHGN